MKSIIYYYFSIFFWFSAAMNTSSFAQLNIDTMLSANQLAQLLAGPGVIVTNVTTTCPLGASGFFIGGDSTNLGISNGIILTTGNANIAKGPNNTQYEGYCSFTAGDPDLNVLSGNTTYDGCAFEMDVVPMCDSIRFRYVFGSEEYPEFVASGFNDVFAFFISGPGIAGTQNIALVPGTLTPVSIDSVNDNINSQYYVNNQNGSTIEYDGFTTVLTAFITAQACQTYHLKLVIADGGDCFYDSGVFLEEKSLQCGYFDFFNETTENAIESCVDDGIFSFCRFNPDTFPLTVKYSIAGTAINGTDYQTIPDSVIIPAGQTCVTQIVIPIPDSLNEGTETIDLIYQPGICSLMDTVKLLLFDDYIVTSNQTLNICSGDSVLINGTYRTTAGIYYDTLIALNGCDSVIATFLNVDVLPVIDSFMIINSSGPNDSDGAVAVFISSGTPPYTFLWNTGQLAIDSIQSSINNLKPDTYIVCITDSRGCIQAGGCGSAVVSFAVRVAPPTPLRGERITIYPNPNGGRFEITITPTKYEQILRKYEVRIMNIFGQCVFQSAIYNPQSAMFKVDISGEPAGVYFMDVNNDIERWVEKVIIVK